MRLSLRPFNLVCQLGWKFALPGRLVEAERLVEHTHTTRKAGGVVIIPEKGRRAIFFRKNQEF